MLPLSTGVSLDIYEGQVTALLGHNGAGKTTLIAMLTGMTTPTDGTAQIYGLDVNDPDQMAEIRKMIGIWTYTIGCKHVETLCKISTSFL